jgi:hypothetical protein
MSVLNYAKYPMVATRPVSLYNSCKGRAKYGFGFADQRKANGLTAALDRVRPAVGLELCSRTCRSQIMLRIFQLTSYLKNS